MKGLLLLLTFGLSLHAEHVQWQGDFEKARVKAIEDKKELMILLITPECSACKQMLRNTFMDQGYITYINQHYVAVLLTKDQKQSYPIELLYTQEYPALFFLNTYEIYTKEALFGYINPARLQKYLQ